MSKPTDTLLLYQQKQRELAGLNDEASKIAKRLKAEIERFVSCIGNKPQKGMFSDLPTADECMEVLQQVRTAHNDLEELQQKLVNAGVDFPVR